MLIQGDLRKVNQANSANIHTQNIMLTFKRLLTTYYSILLIFLIKIILFRLFFFFKKPLMNTIIYHEIYSTESLQSSY